MPNKRLKKNWEHPLYKNGYIKNRDGNCQIVINFNNKQYRKSLKLAFNINNKRLALEILEEEILKVVYDKQKTNILLPDLIKKFLELKEKSIKKATLNSYQMAFQYFDFDNLTTSDNLKDHILGKLIQSDLSNNSKVNYLTILKGFFNFCIDNNYLSSNPILKLFIPKIIYNEIEYYSDVEIQKLIQYFKLKKNKVMVQLIQLINYTGMRISEALKFNPGMVNNDVISIVGKGGYLRHIPITIDPCLKMLIYNYEQFEKKSASNYIIMLKNACEKLEINNLGFHGIRKSFENRLIQKEIPSDLVAEILGHTPEIQRLHYKKLSNAEQIKVRMEKYSV